MRIEHADVVGDGAAHLIGMRAITRAPTRKISGFLRVTCMCENSVKNSEEIGRRGEVASCHSQSNNGSSGGERVGTHVKGGA